MASNVPEPRRDKRSFPFVVRTVIVAPMASKGFAAPFRIPVTHAGTKGLILLQSRHSRKLSLIHI